MSKKIKCALIGSGNIGTDLIYKIKRSTVLEPVWMVGIDANSEGLARAREMGLKTTADGVDGLLPHVLKDGIQIAFDATSAYVHAENSRKLNELGVLMIDLTPAAIGPLCVPPVKGTQRTPRGAASRRRWPRSMGTVVSAEPCSIRMGASTRPMRDSESNSSVVTAAPTLPQKRSSVA